MITLLFQDYSLYTKPKKVTTKKRKKKSHPISVIISSTKNLKKFGAMENVDWDSVNTLIKGNLLYTGGCCEDGMEEYDILFPICEEPGILGKTFYAKTYKKRYGLTKKK